MSGSVFLWQPVSVLMSQAHVTTKDHADVPDLDCHLKDHVELAPSLDSHLTVARQYSRPDPDELEAVNC